MMTDLVGTEKRKEKIRMLSAAVCLLVCLFLAQMRADASETGQLQACETVANADGTVTLYVVTDGSIQSYDYGVAFSLGEATPVSYGFTDEFSEASRKQNGTAIDYYFEEGERVSGNDRYIVFGGMASSGASYSGRMAYVTFALTGTQANIAVVQESAEYASASEILAQGTAYVLQASAASVTDAPATEAVQTAAPTSTDSASGTQSGAGDGTSDTQSTAGSASSSAAQSSAGSASSSGTAGTAAAQSADGTGASVAASSSTAQTADTNDGQSGAARTDRVKTGDAANLAGSAVLAVFALAQIFLSKYSQFVLKSGHANGKIVS